MLTIIAQPDGSFIAKNTSIDCFYVSDAQGEAILDDEGFVTYVDVKGI